jgi:hypothetical protein
MLSFRLLLTGVEPEVELSATHQLWRNSPHLTALPILKETQLLHLHSNRDFCFGRGEADQARKLRARREDVAMRQA